MVPAEESGEADRQLSPTVLIVEDEWIVRAAVAQYLRDCGYRVLEAATADEATSALEADHRIDVVFTDVQMPGSMDGFGIARWSGARDPACVSYSHLA